MTEHGTDPEDALGWWTISGVAMLDALRRVQGGDDPDLVYAELYANSRIERSGDE